MRSNVGSTKRRTKKRHEAINAAPLQPPQHAEADANLAATIDEKIERRTKKRHEAINAAQLQPPQHGEADANPGAAIDALADPSSQVNVNLSGDVQIENITPLGDTESQEDPTKDADSAAVMGIEEEDTHHDAMIVDATIATAPPKHIVPAAAMGVESAEEENTHYNAMIVDATIETAPPKHIVPAAAMGYYSTTCGARKNLEEPVTRPEEEVPEQELTLRDLSEIQKATAEDDATSVKTTIEKPLIVQQCFESTSVQKQPVIVLALEKLGDKESVAVPREPETAKLTERDLADLDEYLHFTPPSFDLLSQDQSQQEEIHAEQRKAAGPVKEPSSQEFGEEIIYTQGTLDRLDKEINDMQMKIAEKKLERILKLREELRELENAKTPQKPETSRTRIYNWATQCKNNNQFDCGVYVLKYMEIVNPNDLAKRNFKIPAWSKEQLEEFREQIVERILCDVDNKFR
ncbi:hypothetical protein PIB30_041983 [Stylosanthes scabra]|uniref:Ubiquitin-like protease family profile domain-containing protein n=1 Tax=Stylosanthes scabra TaxID=79078 RepID=A0ABU6YDX5_9FABA|nr:hypothetical protein [Stylosanthes scabra]